MSFSQVSKIRQLMQNLPLDEHDCGALTCAGLAGTLASRRPPLAAVAPVVPVGVAVS